MKRAIAAILLAHALSFGWSVFTSGFYHDDFVVLQYSGEPHPVQAFKAGGFMVRPLNAVTFPALYKVFGTRKVGWHVTIFALATIGSVLLFLLLGGDEFALLAALIAGVYPNHAVTHHWISSIPQLLAIDLALLSLLVPSLILGGLLFLVALSSYEAVAFLPLVGWALGRRRQLLYFAPLALALLWQRQFHQRPPTFSLLHIAEVYFRGFLCTFFFIA